MGEALNGARRAGASHYPILDALRFVLAFWVAMGHYGMFPLFFWADNGTRLGHFVVRLWNTAVFGTPAVIVFFVISGFCIHLPFIGTTKLAVGRYYLRRYTRILIPVAAALWVYRMGGQRLVLWGEHSILWESPLWSLACEEIYYAAYPLLRLARNRFGWRKLLPSAFLLGAATGLTHPHATNWHVFGPFGTAILLLPVWLLGCLLAEEGATLPATNSAAKIWGWRFLIWLGCWTSEMLHFKVGISYTQTMLWFGVLAYFWVREEVSYGKRHEPNRYLAAAGAWSYSLYLVHVQGMELVGWLHLPSLGAIVNWTLAMAASLGFAYLFYFAVENPSHRLARKIKVLPAPQARVAPETLEAERA
jgi:peptidoglycan/LPS O-acetylase OafA/YrhL